MKWAVAALSVALSGCCTEVGCVDGMIIELGAVTNEFVVGEPVQVTVCVDGRCVANTLTRSADSGLLEGGALSDFFDPNRLLFQGISAGEHSVTVELSRGGTVVFGTSRQMVPTSTSTPNGPFCPPVCHSARITL